MAIVTTWPRTRSRSPRSAFVGRGRADAMVLDDGVKSSTDFCRRILSWRFDVLKVNLDKNVKNSVSAFCLKVSHCGEWQRSSTLFLKQCRFSSTKMPKQRFKCRAKRRRWMARSSTNGTQTWGENRENRRQNIFLELNSRRRCLSDSARIRC